MSSQTTTAGSVYVKSDNHSWQCLCQSDNHCWQCLCQSDNHCWQCLCQSDNHSWQCLCQSDNHSWQCARCSDEQATLAGSGGSRDAECRLCCWLPWRPVNIINIKTPLLSPPAWDSCAVRGCRPIDFSLERGGGRGGGSNVAAR